MSISKFWLCTIFITAMPVSGALAGELGFHPSLAVSEEYNDNVLDSSNNRISDYITHTLPRLALTYKAPVVNADLFYQLDYRHFARKSTGDETVHTLKTTSNFMSPGQMFFLDLSDEFQRVSLNYARDVTSESLSRDQSDRNKATVSPFIMMQITQRTNIKAGYRYVDTRYFDKYGIDKFNHIGFLDASIHFTEKFSLTSGYSYTKEISDLDDFDQHLAFGGFRYEYRDKSYVFGQGGYTWTSFDNGGNFNNRFWSGGLVHVFDLATATINTGVKYDEDPLRNIIQNSFVNASVENALKRGAVRFSANYSEYVLVETGALQTKKYGVTFQGHHEFTSELIGKVAFTAERYKYPLINTYTRRFLVDSGIRYLLTNQLALSLSYIYSVYHSPDIVTDNRHVNRAIIEIRKTF